MIYIIYGLVLETLKAKAKEIIIKNKFNIEDAYTYDLEEVSLSNLLYDAKVTSLFDSKKLLLGYNALFLTGQKSKIDHNTEELEKIIETEDKDTLIILFANVEKLDSRKKIVKQLEKQKKIINVPIPTEKDIQKYIIEAFQKENKKIEPSIADYLLQKVHGKYDLLKNEIIKLSIYEDENISKKAIDELVMEPLNDNIFLLIDSIKAKDKEKINKIYKDLIKQKVVPVQIVALLASQYRLLLKVKLFQEESKSEQEISKILKKHPYQIKLAVKEASKYNLEELKEIIKQLYDLDYNLKSNPLNPEIQMEIYLLK